MSDTAQAASVEKPEEKEADHHPYYRPKDAATLILVDRSGSIPKVLVGRRHDKVVFMPGKFVFPGGRVDKADNRVPAAAPIPKELEENLLKGSPKIDAARAKSLAIAALHSLRHSDVSALAGSLRLLGFLSESAAQWQGRKQKASGVDASEVDRLIAERTAARARKDFKESDRIRDELAAKGVVIKDGKDADGKPVTTWELA